MDKTNIIQKNKSFILIAVLIFVALLFYILNLQTPLYADDYSYSYSFFDGERISDLDDIFLSLRTHYHSLNGRIILQFFSHLFLLIGKGYFNGINTISFLILGLLVFYHGIGFKYKENISLLIFIYCSLFLFTPAFGQSFLWLVGSANYLYGILLILIYLLPFRYISRGGENKVLHPCVLTSLIIFVCMLILGFITGATNENTSIALIAMVMVFIVYYKIHKIKIIPWMFSGLIGNIMGCFFMLTAPGELDRMEGMGGIDIAKILKNTVRITLDIVDYFSILIFIFTLIFSIYICTKRRVSVAQKPDDLGVTMIYILGFLGSAYSMIMSPAFPDRVWSGPLVFLLIALLSLHEDTFSKIKNEVLIQIFPIFIVFMLMVSFCVYGKALYELVKIDKQNNIRIEMIKNTVVIGKEEVYLPAIKSNSRYSCFESGGDLSWDPDEWPNIIWAKYYNISKVIRDDSIVLEEKR